MTNNQQHQSNNSEKPKSSKCEEGFGFLCGRIEENKGKVFIGGCNQYVDFMDSYRCTDCTASFHRDCARKHFKNESSLIPPQPKRAEHWEKIIEKHDLHSARCPSQMDADRICDCDQIKLIKKIFKTLLQKEREKYEKIFHSTYFEEMCKIKTYERERAVKIVEKILEGLVEEKKSEKDQNERDHLTFAISFLNEAKNEILNP